MDSKLRIILISARTNLKYLKIVFQIAAWGFLLHLMTVTRPGWKDFQSRNLLCVLQCYRKSKIWVFYANICSLENNWHKMYPNFQKFKLPCDKSKGGKQRMPMDLSFCTTSVKNNQTITLGFLVRAETRLNCIPYWLLYTAFFFFSV